MNDSNAIGISPFGSFHGSDFDTVMLQNGNLHVQIPIASVPQRGGKVFTWRFIYDTPTWEAEWQPNPTPTDPNNGTYRIVPVDSSEEDSGWRLTNSNRWKTRATIMDVQCPTGSTPAPTYRENYRLVDPDGTAHPFPLRAGGAVGAPTPFCQPSVLAGPAIDGSGIYWDLQSGKITLKDGSTLTTDTNGNVYSETADTLNRNNVVVTNGPTVAYVTPLGRSLNGPSYTTWVTHDAGGATQTYKLDYGAFDNLTSFCGSVPHGIYNCFEYQQPALLPVTLTLPNSRTYQFTYQNNSVFQLTRIDLPTGGSIAYTYINFAQSQPYPPHSSGPARRMNLNWNIRKRVATRTVTSGSQVSQWQYSGGVIINPDSTREVHTFQKVPASGAIKSSQSVETDISYQDAAGNVLKTIHKDWTGEQGAESMVTYDNLRVIRETTTLDNGQVTKVETDYETFPYTVTGGLVLPGCTCTATRMNVKERREYDFAGAMARKTVISYLHNTATNASVYVGLNIVDRPSDVVVFNSNGQVAKTSYEYDTYTAGIQASGAVQHSTSFGTSYLTRGNVTAVKRWRNTDGALLTTRYQYDDAGNRLSETDPLSHTTTFSYTDNWSTNAAACAPSGQGKAYVTQVKNALNRITTMSYYSCPGVRGSITDPNNLTTSFLYDWFGRTVQVWSSAGDLVHNDYDDANRLTTTQLLSTGSTSFTAGSGMIK